jgi:hypothetical protein
MRNAARRICGISWALPTSHECLTTGLVIPVMSHSWKASLPSTVLRTWPVMHTSGVESICASAIGVTRFVAPGPDVASTTPTRPDARAYPSAMCPAPCSWRTRTWRTVVPRAIAS